MTGIDNELFERAVAGERKRARRNQVVAATMGVVLLAPVGFVLARTVGVSSEWRIVAAPLIAFGMVTAGVLAVKTVQWCSTHVVMSFLQPGGRGRAPVSHSRAEALAAAGRVDEARAEFDAARAGSGADGHGDIASLRAEAEFNATAAGDPRRAEELFLRIRRAPQATANDELYASHRLIDLYLGPLADPGRVNVELRRMADRFPGTVDGTGALAALKRRKDEHSG